MYIKKLQLKNFGPIDKRVFQFEPQGINVIYGANAAGKTQALAAIYAALFHYSILQYHGRSAYQGETRITICSENVTVDAVQVHTQQKSYLIAESFDELELLSVIKREKIYFYFPGYERTRKAHYKKQDIRNAFDFLLDIGLEGHHILGNCNAKTEMNILMTEGEERYLNLICFLMNIPKGSVVVGDSILSFYDDQLCDMVIEMLLKTRGIQFILAENDHHFGRLKEVCVSAHRLEQPTNTLHPVSYNYKEIPRHEFVSLKKETREEAEEQTIVPIIYRLGDVFACGESKGIEFKEIKGMNPCKSIVDNAEIYINAFLNGKTKEMGKIFWGVSDDRIITGVTLTYKDRDIIQKQISERMSQATPIVHPDSYLISFHKTFTDKGDGSEDTYIVEIDVYPHESEYFYSTSKGEVYIKTVGGKQKIDAFELQHLLIERMGGKT